MHLLNRECRCADPAVFFINETDGDGPRRRTFNYSHKHFGHILLTHHDEQPQKLRTPIRTMIDDTRKGGTPVVTVVTASPITNTRFVASWKLASSSILHICHSSHSLCSRRPRTAANHVLPASR